MHKHITMHAVDDAVDHESHVSGNVWPPHTPVQVYVHSLTDGKWYKQEPARIHGIHWSTTVKYGYLMESVGHEFEVVAVIGRHIEENVLDQMPDDVLKSHAQRTRRK